MTQTPLLTLLLVLGNDCANQILIYQVRITEGPQIRRILELKINPLHKICVSETVGGPLLKQKSPAEVGDQISDFCISNLISCVHLPQIS